MGKYFSDTLNVLTNVEKVQQYPFPHTGTFDCFPADIYAELVEKRPPWNAIAYGRTEENNRRIDMPAAGLLKSERLAPIWRDFVEYHTSHDFYLQILGKFEYNFRTFYPQLKNMRDYKTGIRYEAEADIYLDCQLSVNTPVKEKSTVNHPHVDNPLELWASLLYMKEPDDDAGGDLILHKCIRPPTFHGKREADLDCIRPVIKIPYSPNAYVCFINSPMSIHSVTERQITEKPRLMVNISLEFREEKLFNV